MVAPHEASFQQLQFQIGELERENLKLKSQNLHLNELNKKLQDQVESLENEILLLKLQSRIPDYERQDDNEQTKSFDDLSVITKPQGDMTNITKEWDILIIYCESTGEHSANELVSELMKAKSSLRVFSMPCPKWDAYSSFNPQRAEELVASSKCLVALLTENSLQHATFAFGMQSALLYQVPIVLVHDQSSCEFPSTTEQPKDLRQSGIFDEKAIVLIPQYVESTAEQVIKKFAKIQETSKSDICILHDNSTSDVMLNMTSWLDRSLVRTTSHCLHDGFGKVAKRNSHEFPNMVCSYSILGDFSPFQMWYSCRTCQMKDNEGCCTACALLCHEGHSLVEIGYTSFYCDCGEKNPSCKAVILDSENPPYKQFRNRKPVKNPDEMTEEELEDAEITRNIEKDVSHIVENCYGVAIVASEQMTSPRNLQFLTELIETRSRRLHLYFPVTESVAAVLNRIPVQAKFKSLNAKKSGKEDSTNDGMIAERVSMQYMLEKLLKIEQQSESCKKAGEIKTRAFLSHKRSSAQGIAGRLFQELSKDYKIFLDSEADFKLNDLQLIVKNTQLFIFILSEGILDSFWCLQELRSAIQNRKKVLVVRDFSYKLPKQFPEEARDVQQFLLTAKTIDYISEFFTQCVDHIRRELGPNDTIINCIEDILAEKDPYLLQRLKQQNLGHDESLIFYPQLSHQMTVPDYCQAIQQYYGIPLQNVKKLQVLYPSYSEYSQESSTTRKWALLNDTSLQYVSVNFPKLEELNLIHCNQVTNRGLEFLGNLRNLQTLHITVDNEYHPETDLQNPKTGRPKLLLDWFNYVDDDGLLFLAEGCGNLRSLILDFPTKITDAGISILCAKCGIDSLGLNGALVSDQIMRFIAKQSPTIKFLKLHNCNNITSNAISYLNQFCNAIEHLDLSKCNKFGNEGLENLEQLSDTIKSINLSDCHSITESNLNHFLMRARNLREISLNNLYDCVTDKTMASIYEYCQSAIEVQVANCPRISKTGRQYLELIQSRM